MVLLDVVYNHFGQRGTILGVMRLPSSPPRTRPGATLSITAFGRCVPSRSECCIGCATTA
jgi:hypothetical protein